MELVLTYLLVFKSLSISVHCPVLFQCHYQQWKVALGGVCKVRADICSRSKIKNHVSEECGAF